MNNKLDIQAFGLALGMVIGLWSMILGWLSISGWGVDFVSVASAFYVGYEPSFVGGIIGGVWGFIDGLIVGGLMAWFYNKLVSNSK